MRKDRGECFFFNGNRGSEAGIESFCSGFLIHCCLVRDALELPVEVFKGIVELSFMFLEFVGYFLVDRIHAIDENLFLILDALLQGIDGVHYQ